MDKLSAGVFLATRNYWQRICFTYGKFLNEISTAKNVTGEVEVVAKVRDPERGGRRRRETLHWKLKRTAKPTTMRIKSDCCHSDIILSACLLSACCCQMICGKQVYNGTCVPLRSQLRRLNANGAKIACDAPQ